MKSRAALLFESPGRWEVRDVDVDPPKDHEVLVRMVASGLCHSDVHYNIGDQVTAMPMCGGHEGAGIVEEVGAGVARLKPGDHVVTSFIPSCGHCRYCATGRQNLCQSGGRLQLGPQLDGTYRMHYEGQGISQFMLISTFSAWSTVPEQSLVKVPDDVPLETVCLLGCGVGTGFGSAVNAANVRTGDVVIVMGVGGVGINAVQGAALAGASAVIAVDPLPFKLEMAAKLGATKTFGHIDEAAEYARSITDGQGADSAIVTIDVVTGEHVAQAFDAVAKGGTVVVTGMASVKAHVGIPVSLLTLAGYQKRIQGCLYGMGSPAVDVLREIDLYRAGHLKLDELITARYKIDDINRAVDDLIEGRNIRGVIMHEH
ncbi:MAG TPA: NDMA-dependent alcohol dehydrogenase [Acidimicrobiales bacterium]|nr:NDMA-dependent alcohol dehydrogenase [Acidimicrobiales bacterium]